jgi:hypothetical protein
VLTSSCVAGVNHTFSGRTLMADVPGGPDFVNIYLAHWDSSLGQYRVVGRDRCTRTGCETWPV